MQSLYLSEYKKKNMLNIKKKKKNIPKNLIYLILPYLTLF